MSQPYRSLEAELHDAFWNADDDLSELPLMASFLCEHPGTALEIGSGSGRLMLPLIQQGFDLEGLELSPDMRALAAAKAAQLGLQARVHDGDMSDWQAPRAYHALLAPAFTLQLAGDPAATLRHWCQWLVPGGGLYLTTFVPYAEILGEQPEGKWYLDHRASLADGRSATLETRHRIDLDVQQLTREHRYGIEGDPSARHECRQQLHWFEPEQLHQMLRAAGFQTDRLVLDFDPELQLTHPGADDFDGITTHLARRSRAHAV